MIIYETNSGLGWRERAYFIKIVNNAYLCVGVSPFTDTELYTVGWMKYDMEDYEMSESSWNIDNSELHGTFMFEYIKKALQNGKLTILDGDKPINLETLCWLCN